MYTSAHDTLITLYNGVPYQIRTGVNAVKGHDPRPLDERDNLVSGRGNAPLSFDYQSSALLLS